MLVELRSITYLFTEYSDYCYTEYCFEAYLKLSAGGLYPMIPITSGRISTDDNTKQASIF